MVKHSNHRKMVLYIASFIGYIAMVIGILIFNRYWQERSSTTYVMMPALIYYTYKVATHMICFFAILLRSHFNHALQNTIPKTAGICITSLLSLIALIIECVIFYYMGDISILILFLLAESLFDLFSWIFQGRLSK